jgi:Fe2+ or Zn2+ uptake regulation protein
LPDWIGHARQTLERDGYRVSGPRSAVVETLADLGCSVTAKEIADRLHERAGPATSRSTPAASITTTSSARAAAR